MDGATQVESSSVPAALQARGGTAVLEAAPKLQPAAAVKVPVELHVMSQCPDAHFCQRFMGPVLEKTSQVSALRVHYIAALQEGDAGVSCMHGPEECKGNAMQLCLQRHLPAEQTLAQFYPVLLCLQDDVAGAEQLKTCMAQAKVTPKVQAKVLACAGGAEATSLAVASAKTVKERGVRKSCTIFIGGKQRCIRDGGRFYDCEGGDSEADFVASICRAHADAAGGKPHTQCAAVLAAGAAKAPAAQAAAGGG